MDTELLYHILQTHQRILKIEALRISYSDRISVWARGTSQAFWLLLNNVLIIFYTTVESIRYTPTLPISVQYWCMSILYLHNVNLKDVKMETEPKKYY